MNSKQIQKAITKLMSVQARSTVRCIEVADLRRANKAVLSLRRYAKAIGADPDSVSITLDGGAVPNNYNRGHGGSATTATITATGAEIVRGRARSCSYGDDPMFRGCVIPPDASKPAKHWPPATVAGKRYAARKDSGRLFFNLG